MTIPEITDTSIMRGNEMTQETHQADTYDPYATAENAKPIAPIRTVFGEVAGVDLWPCVLVKGTGKVPFDPLQHSTDQRRTAIDICIVPFKGDYNIECKIIAESNDWAKIMLPSLKALGVDLRSLNGRYVQAQRVPNGRKYVDKASGESKESTTLKFVAIYPDSDVAQAAADTFYSHAPIVQGEPTPPGEGVADRRPAALPTTAVKPQMERAKAATFLKPMFTACKGDLVKFAEMITANRALAEHFTLESPEVQAIIAGA